MNEDINNTDKFISLADIEVKEKDLFILSLANYFITEKKYNPVVVHGIDDEIWLENMQEEYKIIRIVSHYIHNDEQLDFDIFKTNKIISKLKLKTFSIKMKSLSIYTNLGENANIQSDKDNIRISASTNTDLKNTELSKLCPDIVEKTKCKEGGIELFMKLTNDINRTNSDRNIKAQKLFATKKPIVTYIFITICIIMFILTRGSTDIETLLKYGANNAYLTKSGEYYRLLSSMFIHIGLLHLLFNMYALYIIGPQVESFYGKFKYFLIYILSGVSGSILSITFSSNTVSAGASGAIFGLMGALLYFGFFYRNYLGSVIKSQIVPIIILNLVIGFSTSGIDNAAHIGGLIGGILTSLALGVTDKTRKADKINGLIVLALYFTFIIYICFVGVPIW
mgnify:FL=1